MNSSHPTDHDRIFELLADQAIEGLSTAEQVELKSLLQANPDVDVTSLDRTAAMLDIAAAAEDSQPLPLHLRECLLALNPSEPPVRAYVALASEKQPRNWLQWREGIAWTSAAACLVLAVIAWSRWPANSLPSSPSPNLPSVAENSPPPSRPTDGETLRPNSGPTIAELRDQLLSSSPDVLHLQLVSDNGGGGGSESDGDIVWSSGRQIGYLRLRALARGEATQRRLYQVWIVGSDVSGNEIIDGGIFVVDRSAGDLILPIQADQFVQQPKMFFVSMESSGDTNDWVAPLMAQTDGL